MNEIDLIIKVQSEMKQEMADVRKEVKQLGKDTEKTATSMESSFKKAGQVIQGVMGAAILKSGSEMIKNSEKQGLALEILKLKSKDVYDQLLQTESATFGLANKFDMVTAANKAMAFGIDLSNGKLTSLMKISSKLATVMGIETKQAFDDLITSSARQQKLIADNLGVMIDKVKVDTAYAAALGKTKSQLTEMEQSQAFLNEILKKGAVITGDLSDEFIKMNTKGTKAIKTLETAVTTSINTMARLFVGLGDTMGFIAARVMNLTSDFRDYEEKELERFNKFRIDSEKVTMSELNRIKKLEVEKGKEFNSEIIASYRAYYKELQDLKDFYDEEKMYAKQAEHFAQRQKQGRDATKLHYQKLAKLNKEYGLKVIEGREVDFDDFKSHMLQKIQLSEKYFQSMAKMARKTALFDYLSTAIGERKKAVAEDKRAQAVERAKQEKWAKDNKSRIQREQNAIVSDIIKFEKEKIGFNELSNEEQIIQKEKFEDRKKALLNTRNIQYLSQLRLQKARELDIEKNANLDVLGGLNALWNDVKQLANIKGNEFITEENIKKAQEKTRRVQAEKEILDDILAQRISFNEKIISEEKKSADKEKRLKEKHFSILQSFGSQYLDAILAGNAAKIPEILAQQSMMFGQQIFWDGLKTWWFGISENTIFPGLGANATQVGIAEMGIGAGMMGAGAVASNALGGGSGNNESGASERNAAASQKQEYNLNVVTQLYGSRTEARDKTKQLIA